MGLRRIIGFATAMALVFLAAAGCSKAESEDNVIDLKITGMTCNHCVEHVTQALQSVEGVDTAVVDLDKDSAVVHYGDTVPSREALIKAVEKAGYGAEVVVKSDKK